MSLTERSITAAKWEFGSVAAQAFSQLAVMAVLGRLIPPNDFGLYAISSMALGMIAMFSEVGVGPAIIQRKEITNRFVNSAFTLSLLLGIVSASVCWIASPFIADFFREPGVTILIRVMSVTLIVSGYIMVASALLEREILFRKLAIINITSYAIGYGLIGISMALMGMGVWAIVWATISQSLIRMLMLRRMGKWVIRIELSRPDLGAVVRFGGGISIARVFTYASSQIDHLAVGRLISTSALGLYQMANTVLDMPRRFLGSVIDRVMFAVMSRVQEDTDRLRTGYLKAIELANVLLLSVTVFMIITAPELVTGILGERWSGSIVPLQILLIQVPLRASIRMADQVGGATGKVYYVATTKILYAAMVGVAALFGIRWGLIGVATAVTLATIVNWLIMVRFGLQAVKATFREYLCAWIPACRVCLVVIGSTWVSAEILRRTVGSEIIRLGTMGIFTLSMVLLLVWVHPYVIGNTAVQLALELGKRIPFSSGFFERVEKHVLINRSREVDIARRNIG
jgi:O-antigen/teichoic acid export membrane protein